MLLILMKPEMGQFGILDVVQVPDDLPAPSLASVIQAAAEHEWVIVTHQGADSLGPADLENWVAGVLEGIENGKRDIRRSIDETEPIPEPEPEADPPWEDDMRYAVSRAMELITWSPETGTAEVPYSLDTSGDGGPAYQTCRNLEDIQEALHQIGEAAWCGSVPWEKGPVFEFDPVVVDEMLEDHEEENLRRMGWA